MLISDLLMLIHHMPVESHSLPPTQTHTVLLMVYKVLIFMTTGAGSMHVKDGVFVKRDWGRMNCGKGSRYYCTTAERYSSTEILPYQQTSYHDTPLAVMLHLCQHRYLNSRQLKHNYTTMKPSQVYASFFTNTWSIDCTKVPSCSLWRQSPKLPAAGQWSGSIRFF